MAEALKAGRPVTLDSIERFVDGAAVKRVGDLTFRICREVLDDMHLVPKERSAPPSCSSTTKTPSSWNPPAP